MMLLFPKTFRSIFSSSFSSTRWTENLSGNILKILHGINLNLATPFSTVFIFRSMDSRERELEWDIVVDVSRSNVTISFNAYDSGSNQNSDDKVVLPASPLEAYKWYLMSLKIEDGHLSAALESEGRTLQTKKDLSIFKTVSGNSVFAHLIEVLSSS